MIPSPPVSPDATGPSCRGAAARPCPAVLTRGGGWWRREVGSANWALPRAGCAGGLERPDPLPTRWRIESPAEDFRRTPKPIVAGRGPGESSRQARPTRPDHHRQRRGTHHAHLAFTAVARRGGWRPVAHRTGRGPPGRRGPRHRRQSRRADVPRCAGVRRQRPRPYEAVLSHVPMEQMAFRSSAVCRGHGRDDRPAQPFGHRGNERGDGRVVVRAT